MSSMTDIVFLLLIFFMLTASVSHGLNLILPQAGGEPTEKQHVSVTIDKKLTYFIDKKKVPKENLEKALQKALKNQEKPAILLRAEESVAIKEAVTVMDIAHRHQYRVILAVRPK